MASSDQRQRDQTRVYDRCTAVVFMKTQEAFGGLSNMAGGFPLIVTGIGIRTSEALYQACRFPHMPDVQRLIIEQRSPMTAKMKGKPFRDRTRPDWDSVRVKIMRWCLRVKLAQNWDQFSSLLRETGDRPIVEQSRKDDFWGAKPADDGTLVGMNVLGRLLMELREYVKHEPLESLLRVEPPAIPEFLLYGEPIGVVNAARFDARRGAHEEAEVTWAPAADGSLFSAVDETLPGEAERLEVEAAARSLEPYPEYRATDVDWLERVPAHWHLQKLKHTARIQFSNVDKKSEDGEQPVRLCNYVDVYYHDRITSDIEFMEATALPREIAKFQLMPGDVLVTKDSEDPHDICVPAVVAEELPGVLCGYHLAQIRPMPGDAYGPYLSYALASSGIRDQFRMRANGITRFGLSQDDICSSLIPLPPVPEQRVIAAFLDRKTRQIDELIEKKRRLIELLQEKRTALISHAVTKGLKPDAPMKPSGIDWLGDVPEHWTLTRLKFISRLQTGLTLGKKHTEEEQARLVLRPYLRVANVQDGWLDLEHITEVEVLPERVARYELRPGDVLMTEGGDFDKLGRGYVWEGQIPGCLHQNHIFAVRPQPKALDSRFLACILSCAHGRNYFTKTSQQTTNLASTNVTKLGDFPVPLPPVPEQHDIMAHAADVASRLDALITTVATARDRLTQYRQAVISAAVTGKIGVREETGRG